MRYGGDSDFKRGILDVPVHPKGQPSGHEAQTTKRINLGSKTVKNIRFYARTFFARINLAVIGTNGNTAIKPAGTQIELDESCGIQIRPQGQPMVTQVYSDCRLAKSKRGLQCDRTSQPRCGTKGCDFRRKPNPRPRR